MAAKTPNDDDQITNESKTNKKNNNPKNDKNNNNKKKVSTANRLLIDTFVGVFAGFSLAWFITPMDAAVMQNMSGQSTIPKSLVSSWKTILTQPHRYLARREYALVFGTYGGTYLSKNYTDSICKISHQTPEATAFYKFWIVFGVNGGLSVFWKDPGLAKIFSNSAKAKAAPRATTFSWILRDTIHIIGAAVLPDYLEERYKLTPEQWRKVQLTFPLLVQMITTPCHLLGLDFFNHEHSAFSDRAGRVFKRWIPSTGVRMVRMFAPWSIGLLINRDLREMLIDKAEKDE